MTDKFDSSNSSSGDEEDNFERQLEELKLEIEQLEQQQLQRLQQTRQLLQELREIQQQQQNYDFSLQGPYNIASYQPSAVVSNPMNRVPLTVYSTPACHGYCHHHFGSSSTSFAYQYPSISIFDQVSIAPSFLYVPVPIQQLPSQYAPSYLPTNYSNILPGQSAHLYPNGGSDNPNPFYEPLTTPEMPSPPPRLRRGLRDQNEVVAKKPKTEHNDAAP